MLITGVTSSSLQTESQPKLVGLVWKLAATWNSVCVHQMNQVSSHNSSAVMTAS